MEQEVRDALNILIAALEQHYDVARRGDLASEKVLDMAEQRLQDAFFTYDDLLFTHFGAELPFDMVDDNDDDEEDDDDDDDIEFVEFDGEEDKSN